MRQLAAPHMYGVSSTGKAHIVPVETAAVPGGSVAYCGQVVEPVIGEEAVKLLVGTVCANCDKRYKERT